MDDTFRGLGGVHVFRIHGAVYHRIGDLLPAEGDAAKFAQIYTVDPEMETDRRIEVVGGGLRYHVVSNLQAMLYHHNQWVQLFKTAAGLRQPLQNARIVVADRPRGLLITIPL